MPAQISAQQPPVYEKIPNVVGLYKHTKSGRYLGAVKLCRKRREVSLRTKDRKIAERRLRDWIGNLRHIEPEKERTTLRELVDTFMAVNAGKSASTQTHHATFSKRLRQTWRLGMDVEVRAIRPSHIDQWLASHEARWKNTTYNF